MRSAAEVSQFCDDEPSGMAVLCMLLFVAQARNPGDSQLFPPFTRWVSFWRCLGTVLEDVGIPFAYFGRSSQLLHVLKPKKNNAVAMFDVDLLQYSRTRTANLYILNL
jgi:hypothetical protein